MAGLSAEVAALPTLLAEVAQSDIERWRARRGSELARGTTAELSTSKGAAENHLGGVDVESRLTGITG